MPNQLTIENQLKEASQLTGSTWAALVEREELVGEEIDRIIWPQAEAQAGGAKP